MTQTKHKTIDYEYLIVILAVLFLGILFGMTIQQGIIQSTLIKVASNMDGVNIDINFNESKLVEATKNNFVPEVKAIFNNSLINDFQGCSPVPCPCWYEEVSCALYCMRCEDGI